MITAIFIIVLILDNIRNDRRITRLEREVDALLERARQEPHL